MYLFAEQPSHTQYPNQTHIPIVHNIPLCRDEIEKKSKSTLMFLNILNHLPIKHKRQKKLFNLSFKGVEDLVYRFYCKYRHFEGVNDIYSISNTIIVIIFFFRFVWEKAFCQESTLQPSSYVYIQDFCILIVIYILYILSKYYRNQISLIDS